MERKAMQQLIRWKETHEISLPLYLLWKIGDYTQIESCSPLECRKEK